MALLTFSAKGSSNCVTWLDAIASWPATIRGSQTTLENCDTANIKHHRASVVAWC